LIATGAACEGAKVAVAEIDAQAGEETAHLAGNQAIATRADVTAPDSLQAAIRGTLALAIRTLQRVERDGHERQYHRGGLRRLPEMPD
jgi:hypothetical protein